MVARLRSPLTRLRAPRAVPALLVLGLFWLGQAPWIGPALAQEPEDGAEVRSEIEALEEQRRTLQEQIDEKERELERASQAAEEQAQRDRRRRSSDQRFRFGSDIDVDQGEQTADVVAIGGAIKVDGEVDGNAVSVGGQIRINGRVEGEVVAVGRGVELGPDAYVTGNVVSVGGKVDRQAGARVLGEVSEMSLGSTFSFGFGDWIWWSEIVGGDREFSGFRAFLQMAWSISGTVLLAVLLCLILLVVPDPVERVRRTAKAEVWKAALVGLAVELLFIPILVVGCFLLIISIVGIPLILFVLLLVPLLLVASMFGFTAMAVHVGRFLSERLGLRLRSSFLMLLVGLLTIQSVGLFGDVLDAAGLPWSLTAMFGLIGFLIKFVAWTIGLGAVFLSKFGALEPHVQPTLVTGNLPGEGYEPDYVPRG